MKKIILAVLFGLSITQVAPVMADDAVIAETAKKESRVKSYIKKHQVALMVGTGALLLGLGVPCWNTTSANKVDKVDAQDEVLAEDGLWKKNNVKPADMTDEAFDKLDKFFRGASIPADQAGAYTVTTHPVAHADAVQGQPAITYGKYDIRKMWSKCIKTPAAFVKMFNPFVNFSAGYALDYKHVALDVVALLIIADIGYNLITGKPELAETIYNLVSRKISKKANAEVAK